MRRGGLAGEPRAVAPEGGLRSLPAGPIVAAPRPFAAGGASPRAAARTSPLPGDLGPLMPVADRPPASADAGEVVPRPKPAAAPGEARVAGAQREEPAPPAPTSVVIESIEIVAEPESPPAPVRRRTGERAPSGFSDYGAVRSYRYGMGR